MKSYVVLLLAIGIFFFIPDPFDFVFGLGVIVEGICLVTGSILAITGR
jgi:hypothetical protein